MAEQEVERLIEAAKQARMRAYAPYSHFAVGAVVESVDGVLYGGGNVENASYGLTICAERVALVRAISEGASRLSRMAIVADTEQPVSPCGACRQMMLELMDPDAEVILANLLGDHSRRRLAELLPEAFVPHHLRSPLLRS
jgi:cytidine deaminase